MSQVQILQPRHFYRYKSIAPPHLRNEACGVQKVKKIGGVFLKKNSTSPSEPIRNHPHILEIQATHLFKHRTGKPLSVTHLISVSDSYWRKIAEQGFDAVWIMGVWKRSPGALECALRFEALWKAGDFMLKGCCDEDFLGSPYAVYDYTLDPSFGSAEDLAKLRLKLNSFGLKMILDFVSNHLALDHPLTVSRPDLFVQAAEKDFEEDRPSFFKTPQGRYYAHGRDPYFPAWSDTVQVNYFSEGYRQFSEEQLLKIADVCDGVRCDMAMLGLNKIFKKIWNPYLKNMREPSAEYWAELISAVRTKHSQFLFIAEAYWDLEWELQQLGFDYTYDKRFYDRLVKDSAGSVQAHLKAEQSFQSKSMRFIENHDEERAVKVFGVEKSQAAAVAAYTVPGMRFFHEGQIEGKSFHPPIQFIRIPEEKPIKLLGDFYQILLEYSNDEILHDGKWQLLEVTSVWKDDYHFKNMMAWGWEHKNQIRLIILNYSGETSQGRLRFPDEWLKKKTITLNDKMASVTYVRDVEELKKQGLYAALPAWKAHLFEFGV